MAQYDAPSQILARAKKTLLKPVTEACICLQHIRRDLHGKLPTQQALLESRRRGQPLVCQVTAIRRVEQMLDIDEEALFTTEERFEEMYLQLENLQEKTTSMEYVSVFEERIPQLHARLMLKFGVANHVPVSLPETGAAVPTEAAALTSGNPPAPAPQAGHGNNGTCYGSERELRTDSPQPTESLQNSPSKITQSVQATLKRFVSAPEGSPRRSPAPYQNPARNLSTGVSKIPVPLSAARTRPQVVIVHSSSQKAPPLAAVLPVLSGSPPDYLSYKLRTPSKLGSNRKPFGLQSGSKLFSGSKLNGSISQSSSKLPVSAFVANPIASQAAPLSVPSSSGQALYGCEIDQSSSFKSQLDAMTERINLLRAEIKSRKQ